MTEDKKQQFKKRMEVLLEKYTRNLPGKYQEIEDSWKNYQSDLNNPDFSEIFYRLIHTLKGTAATFGFIAQADICFEIQKILLKENDEPSALSKSSADQIQYQLNELKTNINTPAKNISE